MLFLEMKKTTTHIYITYTDWNLMKKLMHTLFVSTSQKISLFLLTLISVTTLSGCNPAQQTPITLTDFALNTVVSVSVYDKKEEPLLKDAIALCKSYEDKLSPTISGSDVYRINHAQQQPVVVDKDTYLLLKEAYRYCEDTNGSLDITILPAKNLWDFTLTNPTLNDIPTKESLSQAIAHVNYQNIKFDDSTLSVQLTDPLSMIDLGCIAKGYIADQIKQYLMEHGVEHGIINLGGNVLTIGTKPDGSTYQVGIQKPFDQNQTPITTISTSNQSIVTSGIYERCFLLNDHFYHHILDTKTGFPIDNDLLSVTIISDSSTQGDALSTYCLTLGRQKGMEYIDSLDNVDAIFIDKDYQIYDTRQNVK